MPVGLRVIELPPHADSMLSQATLRLCRKTSLAPLLAKGLVPPVFRVTTHRSQLQKTGHLYRTRCVLQPRITYTVSWIDVCLLTGQQHITRHQ